MSTPSGSSPGPGETPVPAGWPLDRVDLWIVRAGEFPSPAPGWLAETLSSEESARARSFRHPADAQLYVLAHGTLRAALSHYGGRPATDWRFTVAPGGKPGLVDPPSSGTLQFNLSHAHGVAIVACTDVGPLGVDVEPLARAAQLRGLQAEQFHPSELGWLNAGTEAERDAKAVWLWTAHEALLKACGRGMAIPSREIAIEWGRSAQPRVRVAGSEVGLDWRVLPIRIDHGFVGTLVLKNRGGASPLRGVCCRAGITGLELQFVEARPGAEGFLEF